MTRSERIYRALLLAYPERTRLILGEDMVQLFRDRMRDAGSPLEQANVWFEVITDIAVTAPREHVARRRARQVVEGSAPEPTRPMRPDLAVAAVPLLLAVLLPLVLPGFYRPLFDDRVSILGLPAGAALLIPTTMLAAFGIFVARRGSLREPGAQVLLLIVPLSPLVALLVAEFPFLSVYLLAVVLLAARDRRHAPAIALTGVLLPLLALLLVSGAAAILVLYWVLVMLLMAIARFRWLMYALVIPFALVAAVRAVGHPDSW